MRIESIDLIGEASVQEGKNTARFAHHLIEMKFYGVKLNIQGIFNVDTREAASKNGLTVLLVIEDSKPLLFQ